MLPHAGGHCSLDDRWETDVGARFEDAGVGMEGDSLTQVLVLGWTSLNMDVYV